MTNDTQTPEGYAPFDLYPYNPSQGPAYAFLGLFGAAGIAHFIMMFPYRSAFPIPMIIGCGSSEDLDEAKRGQTIIIGGLVLQILAFALFIVCTLTLQLRLRANPPVQCVAGVITDYRRYFVALYCTSGLFLIRNLVRIIEYKQGGDGQLLSNEAFLYCDEVKPQCRKCVQFGVWCDYSPQPPGPQVSLNHQPDSQSRRPGRPRSDWTSWAEQIRSHAAESVAESPGHLNTMDLEFFHSYMTRTASTLGDGSSQSLLWSEGAPRVGFQHNCILKLILSLSSYHLARLKPIDKQRYSLIAETHLTAALQPAMMLISDLGGDNSPAAYLTSTLICFVALAKGPSPGNLLLTNIEGQVSWLHLLRGVRLVVESAGWSSIFSGMLVEYAPIPSGDTPEHNATTDPTLMADDIEDWRSSLNGISHLIAQLVEEKLGNVYDRELQALTACFERTFRKGQDAALYTVGKLQDVIGWVYRLGDDYMEGLRQRDLISTVMLGHFCVLLRTVEAQFWFMHE
ncbi:hypothetical protein DER46DRAFT_631202 [Fusarium sp. MPI-SDFR-AT-0072]|nr:hypothetical protein DER46DRAFT_631202 [Fusarium sp. MPI-SDFR-AT-0072]